MKIPTKASQKFWMFQDFGFPRVNDTARQMKLNGWMLFYFVVLMVFLFLGLRARMRINAEMKHSVNLDGYDMGAISIK